MAWLDCLGVCSRNPAPVRHSCVCAVACGSKSQVQCRQLSLGTSGSGGWYPEIGDRPKKVLLNPPQKVLSNPKRFYRTSVCPRKGSIEPQWKGFQNHRKGSIEPFASNPPFSGYPFRTFPVRRSSFCCRNVRLSWQWCSECQMSCWAQCPEGISLSNLI